MARSIFIILCVVAFGALAGELQAPEIPERNVHGDSYQFREDGSICDSQGVIRGWATGNRIYDAQWSPIYEMKKGKLLRVADELVGG